MIPIEAVSLNKNLEGNEILRGLDIKIPEGAVYGLLGRNGSGKTTLLKTLIGLFHPSSGQALVLGEALQKGCPPVKKDVGYVAEGEILPGWARISDLIKFEGETRGRWQGFNLDRWLDSERITKKQKVRNLSKGLRKRLELELVLAGEPKVLLMDEPLSGLDPVSRSEFLESFMGYIADKSATVLISSHILTDMERICDRIGVLANGKIEFETLLDDLKEKGALITKQGGSISEQLPFDAKVIASRQGPQSRVWVVSEAGTTPSEYTDEFISTKGNLEEIGVELIRCLDQRNPGDV